MSKSQTLVVAGPTPWVHGLSPEILRSALMAGEAARALATDDHPPTTGGTNAWSESVASLRADLAEHQWKRDNTKNVCTVVSPCGSVAIAVVKGTEGTGDLERAPQTARPLGDAIQFVVGVNQAQLDLFACHSSALPGRLTYFLLVHRTSTQISAELSLPASISEQGYVLSWKPRYPLSPILLTKDEAEPKETFEDQDDVNVAVEQL